MWDHIACKQECNVCFVLLFFNSISSRWLECLTRQHSASRPDIHKLKPCTCVLNGMAAGGWITASWQVALVARDSQAASGYWVLVPLTLSWERDNTMQTMLCFSEALAEWNSASLPDRSGDGLLIWRSQGDLKTSASKEMVALIDVCIPPAFHSLPTFFFSWGL